MHPGWRHQPETSSRFIMNRTNPCMRVSEGAPYCDQHGCKKGRGRLIGQTKGGMSTKLHAICDSQGRPLNLFGTAGQVSDHIGARALLSNIPNVDWLLGDRDYDAVWFRDALKDKGMRARIPCRKQRKTNADIKAATELRSCSAGSRIGGAWQLAMTIVLKSSSPPSPSRQSSHKGYEA